VGGERERESVCVCVCGGGRRKERAAQVAGPQCPAMATRQALQCPHN
jgi:hypothetical protein